MNIPNFPNNFQPKFNLFLQNQPQLETNQEDHLDYQTEILNITKIKEGLYLGDQISGTNLDVVIQFKLTHMINSTGKQIINAWETIGIKYLTLNWEENPNQNLFDSLDEISNKIFDFIEDSFIRGEGLLVYSLKGQNRCCIVIIIYLMKKYKWPLNKCLEFLRNRKQDIIIPNYFMEQLKNFERRMIKRGEGIIYIPWSEDNLISSDEKLMRNTYVNGLKNNVNNAKIISSNFKKKRHIGWADCNNIKKCSLEVVNLNKDLFFKKDVKNIVSHIKMRPSKSCVKGNRKNNLENFNYEDNDFNKKNEARSGSVNQGNNNKFKNENNVFTNIKTINNNNKVNFNMNNNNNNFQGNRLKSDNVSMKNNFIKNNSNNNKSINNNNFDNSMPINILNAGNMIQKENINLNNNYMKNINLAHSLQPPLQKNNMGNSNNIYNNNFNNDNDDDINSMPFGYTQMNPLQNNIMNNNNCNQKNNNVQQNKNLNENDLIKNNNNFNNTYSGQQQNISSSINENNKNMINYINYNIGSINSLNPANIKNYSHMKENNILNNQNNNDKAKIIYAEKYEQIINNNIQNIIINQDPNKQEIKSITKIKSENISNNNNIDSEIGPIPNINFNQTHNNYNENNKIIQNQNTKPQSKKIPKNNETQKNPNLNNYNNFIMNKINNQNDKILINPGIKDNKILKTSDYTNTNLNKNNNFMNYIPINRQEEIYNNKNNTNNLLIKNNFLEYNILEKNNITKPINNFNPNLMKKTQNKQNTQTQLINTKKSNNLYNRPKSQNGPIKIKNDYSLKKPSTPDQISHIRNNNDNIIQKSKYNNLYNPINRSLYSGAKTPNRNDNNLINNRPSTAPQKDKNKMYGNNNSYNNNKFGNNKKGFNNNFSGPNKRLPSPQIHSNNILKTQKNNPRYRAPSPVIRSGNAFNNMGIGNIKRSSNVMQNKIY